MIWHSLLYSTIKLLASQGSGLLILLINQNRNQEIETLDLGNRYGSTLTRVIFNQTIQLYSESQKSNSTSSLDTHFIYKQYLNILVLLGPPARMICVQMFFFFPEIICDLNCNISLNSVQDPQKKHFHC